MTKDTQHQKHTSEMSDSSDLTRRQALKLALGVALAMVPTAALAEGEQRRPKKLPVGNAPPVEYAPGGDGSDYVDAEPESGEEKEENQDSSPPKPLLPARSPFKFPFKKTP